MIPPHGILAPNNSFFLIKQSVGTSWILRLIPSLFNFLRYTLTEFENTVHIVCF